MTKIIDTGTTRLRGSMLIAAALAAAGPSIQFWSASLDRQKTPRNEKDCDDLEAIAAADAKRARKNAKRLKDAAQS